MISPGTFLQLRPFPLKWDFHRCFASPFYKPTTKVFMRQTEKSFLHKNALILNICLVLSLERWLFTQLIIHDFLPSLAFTTFYPAYYSRLFTQLSIHDFLPSLAFTTFYPAYYSRLFTQLIIHDFLPCLAFTTFYPA
jgi:hypothetical protein